MRPVTNRHTSGAGSGRFRGGANLSVGARSAYVFLSYWVHIADATPQVASIPRRSSRMTRKSLRASRGRRNQSSDQHLSRAGGVEPAG